MYDVADMYQKPPPSLIVWSQSEEKWLSTVGWFKSILSCAWGVIGVQFMKMCHRIQITGEPLLLCHWNPATVLHETHRLSVCTSPDWTWRPICGLFICCIHFCVVSECVLWCLRSFVLSQCSFCDPTRGDEIWLFVMMKNHTETFMCFFWEL